MKFLIILVVVVASFKIHAGTYLSPLHTSEEVLSALYTQAEINPSDVAIVIFRFDYSGQFWHIELTNKERNCIDCYPTYSFKNEEKLKLFSLPHG